MFLICFPSSFAEAVPKRILELMNVPGLTRENVASHLQVRIYACYRLSLYPFFYLMQVFWLPFQENQVKMLDTWN